MKTKTRYAVVGLGHISQVAVLPAFEHAKEAELVGLISGDEHKLHDLSGRYGVELTGGYDDLERIIEDGDVDAVYVSVPNHLHREYAVRAANAGAHVLCEKPMAVTEAECEEMIAAAADNGVKLMIAYRLHFEPTHLGAIEMVERGRLGRPRIFESVFTQRVKRGDVRLNPIRMGGGSVFDMGIYCINAARYLFRAEPIQVQAMTSFGRDERFEHCDEMTGAILRFPDERLAIFLSSFGAKETERLRVIGTEGTLEMQPAYSYSMALEYQVDTGEGEIHRRSDKRDQFAPELDYFSRCIATGEDPEPGGTEGLADVRIINAVYESASTGRAVDLVPLEPPSRPTMDQATYRPPVEQKPREVRASGPKQGTS